jgi:sulfur carrier protein ThiS adenylyltransferase
LVSLTKSNKEKFMSDIDREERYSRQADLVPVEKLAEVEATVIGVGAIGRQVALQLAAMGAPTIQLIDFDTIEEGNLAPQGFMEAELGELKVEAVAKTIAQINSDCSVECISERYSRGMNTGNMIFCCVDKIEVREFLWEALKDKVKMFIDGRMAAEAIRVLVVSDDRSADYYPTTFFSADEAFHGVCTAKSTIYSSNVVAGIMVASLAKQLRGMPLDCDIQLNLLTNEIDAKDPDDIKRLELEAHLMESEVA